MEIHPLLQAEHRSVSFLARPFVQLQETISCRDPWVDHFSRLFLAIISRLLRLVERDIYNVGRKRILDPNPSGNAKAQGRAFDIVVLKDDQIVKIYEVTSLTARKTSQRAKTQRILALGQAYIKFPGKKGKLIPIPQGIAEEELRLP